MNNTIAADSSSQIWAVSFIHALGQGFDVKRGFDVWMYLAYSCFVISYFLNNILYIRALIALGSFWFIMWAFLAPGMGVQIDTLCFNTAYVAINIYQIIRLLKKKMPPKFSELEQTCFDRDFKDVFSPNEFKMLLDKGRLEYLSQNESQICKVGQSFKEIVYVAHINDGFCVELRDSNNNFVSNVHAGSWIGIEEYAIREDYLKNPILNKAIKNGEYELIWEISAHIKEFDKKGSKGQETNKEDDYIQKMIVHPTKSHINMTDYVFLRKRSEGCIIYKFTIEHLEKLYNDRDILFVFKNGLQTLWLSYCTSYIISQNQRQADYYKQIKEKDDNK